MFTGLIEDLGIVESVERRSAAARLRVKTSLPSQDVKLGDSVAVNGICLTVVEIGSGTLAFDVSPETISSSGFRFLKGGSRVNLERALRLSDRLGGHLVTGHVDAVATVTGRVLSSGNIVFSFRVDPPEIMRYIVAKGSVAIDGISLTVNTVEGATFSVNIIPHTAEMTTLSRLSPGEQVNIETDILARYVERLLDRGAGGTGLTADFLAKNGFM